MPLFFLSNWACVCLYNRPINHEIGTKDPSILNLFWPNNHLLLQCGLLFWLKHSCIQEALQPRFFLLQFAFRQYFLCVIRLHPLIEHHNEPCSISHDCLRRSIRLTKWLYHPQLLSRLLKQQDPCQNLVHQQSVSHCLPIFHIAR